MKNILIPGLIIGGLLAFLAAKKRALQNLLLNVIDIGINRQKSNIRQLVFNVKFNAENLENVPVSIKQINLNLFAGENRIADYRRSVNLTILPEENREFFIEMQLNNLAAVTTIIQSIAAQQAPEFNVKGTITTDLGTITINS
jgi:hypothetical protein